VQLSLLNFPALVQLGSAACQKACNKLLNLAVGSVTRSIIEASSSVALWLQYLIVQVYLGTRLKTSQGADVDSFVNDFTLVRDPAVPSTGTVTFSRSSAGYAALIVPYFAGDGSVAAVANGTTVITVDRSQTFGVVTDTTNAAWNTGLGGYFLPIGAQSVDLTVQNLVPAAAGNIQAGAISLLGTSIPGVDFVTNTAAFGNGKDAESDDALKARFAVFIATRARATVAAVEEAIISVQQGLSYATIENTLPNGQARNGFFTVTIDDGTGNPSSTLISAVYAAIDQVRPIGSVFTVQGPAVIYANVNMTISAAAGYSKATLQGLVSTAIQNYINGLGIGQALSYTRLSALAYGVPGVSTVSNVLLNNGTSDIGGGPTQVVKATGASVVVN
jgi:uncharacterized phage protein gp47/JayE